MKKHKNENRRKAKKLNKKMKEVNEKHFHNNE
jgi:hypothetical protein